MQISPIQEIKQFGAELRLIALGQLDVLGS